VIAEPAHNTTVGMHNGSMAILVDGTPITGLGWNAQCAQMYPTAIKKMTKADADGSGFNLSRVLFALGKDAYHACGECTVDGCSFSGAVPFDSYLQNAGDPACDVDNPPFSCLNTHKDTWDGLGNFNLAFLKQQLDRRLQASTGINPPKPFIIIQIALDGAIAWENSHPDLLTSTCKQDDPKNHLSCKNVDHPHYGTMAWREAAHSALQNLVHFVQSDENYNAAVIGYELFNGPSLDTNPRMDPIRQSGINHFRQYLQNVKYGTVDRLRAAWATNAVDFTNAEPLLAFHADTLATHHPWAPLFVPRSNQRHADTREYIAWAEDEVVRDFASAIKTYTNRRAIVGARFGEALYGTWFNFPQTWCADPVCPDWSWSTAYSMIHQRTRELYSDPNLDFFEIWDVYGMNRHDGPFGGSSTPSLPVQGLAAQNKLYIIQNDFRTYGADPLYREGGLLYDQTLDDQKADLGFAPDFVRTISKQRRVFTSALVNGMTEWLWQMSYPHAVNTLMPEWRRYEDIFERSLNVSRRSVAEVAYVIDPELGKYFVDSMDNLKDTTLNYYDGPGVMQYLVNHPMNAWAKAGVPYDMVFLDQVRPDAPKKYKVYVFFHTISLSRAQIDVIHQTLAQSNAVGIFSWADGLLDENGNVASNGSNPAVLTNASYLTGLTIHGGASTWSADLYPSPSFRENWPDTLGTLPNEPWRIVGPNSTQVYPNPMFWVTPNYGGAYNVAAVYSNYLHAVVMRQMPGWGSIYSGSPYIPVDLIRYALNWAGGTNDYINTKDNLYLNESFLGINATGTHTVTVKLPGTPVLHSVLVDLDGESDAGLYRGTGSYVKNGVNVTDYTGAPAGGFYTFEIPVQGNRTYLFYRGTAESWFAASARDKCTFDEVAQPYATDYDFGLPSPFSTITGDFNGDGRTDYGRLGDAASHFYLSQGQGNFAGSYIHQYPPGWHFGAPSNYTTITGDFDGDGRTDYGRLGDAASHFFLSTGGGSFSDSYIQEYPADWRFGAPSAWETITGDFNGDGRTDYGRLGDDASHFFLSNGGGWFSDSHIQEYPEDWHFGAPTAWATITGDFDGDGRTDYGRLGDAASHFFLSSQTADGTFLPSHIHQYPPGWHFGAPSNYTTITGDFDGDGRTDYGRLGDAASHFFLSTGGGSFSDSYIQEYPADLRFGAPSAWEAITGDFNYDGKTDYARLGDSSAYFFLSNGNGTFSDPVEQRYGQDWRFGLPSKYTTITGDFDGYGKTDYGRLGGTEARFFLLK
jgi:hypothetical protein